MDSCTRATINVKQNVLKSKQNTENVVDVNNKERCSYTYFSVGNIFILFIHILFHRKQLLLIKFDNKTQDFYCDCFLGFLFSMELTLSR